MRSIQSSESCLRIFNSSIRKLACGRQWHLRPDNFKVGELIIWKLLRESKMEFHSIKHNRKLKQSWQEFVLIIPLRLGANWMFTSYPLANNSLDLCGVR